MQIGVLDVGHSKKSLKNAVLQYSQTNTVRKSVLLKCSITKLELKLTIAKTRE